MNERPIDTRSVIQEDQGRHSVFETVWPESPPKLIKFFRLAEEEGAYATKN